MSYPDYARARAALVELETQTERMRLHDPGGSEYSVADVLRSLFSGASGFIEQHYLNAVWRASTGPVTLVVAPDGTVSSLPEQPPGPAWPRLGPPSAPAPSQHALPCAVMP